MLATRRSERTIHLFHPLASVLQQSPLKRPLMSDQSNHITIYICQLDATICANRPGREVSPYRAGDFKPHLIASCKAQISNGTLPRGNGVLMPDSMLYRTQLATHRGPLTRRAGELGIPAGISLVLQVCLPCKYPYVTKHALLMSLTCFLFFVCQSLST